MVGVWVDQWSGCGIALSGAVSLLCCVGNDKVWVLAVLGLVGWLYIARV